MSRNGCLLLHCSRTSVVVAHRSGRPPPPLGAGVSKRLETGIGGALLEVSNKAPPGVDGPGLAARRRAVGQPRRVVVIAAVSVMVAMLVRA